MLCDYIKHSNISKAAVNPGKNFGPYNVAKAATLALMKQVCMCLFLVLSLCLPISLPLNFPRYLPICLSLYLSLPDSTSFP